MTDPDVRVVILGLPQEERRLRKLLKLRAEAEREGRALEQVLKRIERELRLLEQEVARG